MLETLSDQRARGIIEEDFKRINDIGEQKTGTLIWATRLFGIQVQQTEKPQALGMRLFLDYPDAFEYAWARYCVYGSTSRISRHNIPCEGFEINATKLETFSEEVKHHLSELAKGEECRVHHYDEGDQVVILVARGSYIRTIARWEGGEIKIDSFRPASGYSPLRQKVLPALHTNPSCQGPRAIHQIFYQRNSRRPLPGEESR